MKNYFGKVKSYVVAHKILSGVIFVVVLFVGNIVYGKITSTSGETRYIATKIERGNIVASVSGTGQVSASNQLDIKPKVSGDVIYLGASNGQRVASGTLLVQLDASDAQKAVRDAKANLDSANLSLQKLKIQNSNENLTADQKKAYDDAWDDVSNAFIDLTPTLDGLNTVLEQSNLSDSATRAIGKTAETYKERATTAYYNANKDFQKSRKDFASLTSTSPTGSIENILVETYNTTKLLSDAIKNTVDFVDLMAKESSDASIFVSTQNTLSSYTSTVSGHLSTLLSSGTSIKSSKDSAQNSSLDIQSAELSVTQRENALQDAKDKLADYFIRAPYAGTVANMTIKKSDSVSSSTVVATLITDQQIAEISLNEVDVAKIKLGEKANLTFDAVPDLSISGLVEEIDSIGTVSQGVVTYNVKITFGSQDERIKPGMSVSADIITDMKENILVAPNSAVKSQNGRSYVEMFDAPLPRPTDGLIGSISKVAPRKVPVEIGLSNDSQTEIISGVNEGDEIVIRTISPKTATATAPSIFGGAPANRTTTNGGSTRTTPRTN